MPQVAADPFADVLRQAAAVAGPVDRPAAEALAEAMATWNAADIACYREAVLREVTKLGNRPPDGFLAAEVLALLLNDADAPPSWG